MSHHRNWDAPSHPGWTATKPPKKETLIGTAIRSWCERTGVSQSKLATRLDVDHSYISRIAAGVRIPNQDFALRLADAIGIEHADMALMLCEIDPKAFREGIEKTARGSVIASINQALDRFP